MDSRFRVCGIFLIILVTSCATQRSSRTCERCLRTPSSCRRISGLYTVTVLTEGTYNPVVEIPASACSINITELSSSSNYIAVKTSRNKGIVNSYWALGQPGQYYGAGTRFAYDRSSGNCPGSCIYAEGPTSESTVVQILYYDQNPGISYEFVLPNSVPFQPFDGTKSKESGLSGPAASSRSSPSSALSPVAASIVARVGSSKSKPLSSHQHRRRYRGHHRRRGHASSRSGYRPSYEGDSQRERYTGSQTSRSEGRPEETAAQSSLPYYRRRIVPNQRNGHDYTSSKYGSHTLGGRGLSYTASNSGRTRERTQLVNQKSERYISGTSSSSRIRKISAPQYRPSSSSNQLSYSRQQPRYQSLTSETSYRNGVNQRQSSRYLSSGSSSRLQAESGQFRWRISGLTKCSRTCGGGAQNTNIVCVSVSGRTQVVVTPENCANSRKPRVQTVECNTSPCEPAWEADQWSECSVTCGSGTQTRKIECRQKFSPSLTLRVSADQCGQDKKPAVAQQCERGFCAKWTTENWQQCSKECGGGVRKRDVKCIDGFDSPIPSNYCTEAKPKDKEECNSQPCNAQWWISPWSSVCSESCGSGYQVRSALCMSSDGSLTPESKCSKSEFPEVTKSCFGDSSCRGTWFTGSWGRCLAKCGKGVRRRAVICLQPQQGGSIKVSNGQCNPNLKPVSEEQCENTDCSSLWFTSPWSKCSVTCGNGFKSREVSCIDRDGNPSERCEPTLKPETQKACLLESCSLYQRTAGRVEKTQEGSAESEFQEFKSETKTVKHKNLEEKANNQEQKQRKEIGDDHEIEPYIEENENDDSEGAKASSFDSSEEEYEQYDSDLDESESESNDGNDEDCKDTFWNCLMVIQSRLCQYSYYRSLCCASCPSI